MDLYIQVGVILLFLAALSLFVYFYTQPAQQFTDGINATTTELNQRLATAENTAVAPYLMNTNVSGATVLKLMEDAKSSELAILVQTKTQRGLVVNYGYQLRSTNAPAIRIKPNGTTSVTSPVPAGATADSIGSLFEQNFVTTVKELFQGATSSTGTFNSVSYGSTGVNLATLDLNTAAGILVDDTSYVQAPHVTVVDPGNPQTKTTVTGSLYTDQVIHDQFIVNEQFSLAKNQSTAYYINPTGRFKTTLVSARNGDIVGVYVEEAGIPAVRAPLAQIMTASGIK